MEDVVLEKVEGEAGVLSAAEFREAVLLAEPRVAVFDCDGTMWSGDAGSAFMRWSIETGLPSREMADWIGGRYEGYLRGDVSEAAICGEMVQMYSGLRDEEMRWAAAVFFEAHVRPGIFPEMLDLALELGRLGAEVWAVSSTNDWVIEEGVRAFGIGAERVRAARVEVTDGRVTGKLLRVPTDEAKVAALAGAGVVRPDVVFGNSVHDAAMLGIARRAFAVNPTAALRERSAAEGWPVFLPGRSRTGG